MAHIKNKLFLVVCFFCLLFTLVKQSCSNISFIKTKVNADLGIFIENNICNNEHIQPVISIYQFGLLKEDIYGLKNSIKEYPYEEVAKEYKNKVEQYILRFDLKREYREKKRAVFMRCQELKNFIFLKYQLLILRDAEWKQMYAKKVDNGTSVSSKITVTGIDQVNNAIIETSTGLEDRVPATSTFADFSKNVPSAAIAHETYFDYSTLHIKVLKKSEHLLQSIEKEMINLETLKLKEIKPLYVDKIQKLNDFANQRMKELSTMIREINDCSLVNGSYFHDETSMECEYAPITRESFREYFKDTQSLLESKSKELVEVDYKNDFAAFQEDLEELRLSFVDLFEDWGDSILVKLKKVLVVENLTSNEELYADNDEGNETLKKWKEFELLKNDVIEKRDYLLNFDLEIKEIVNFVNELKKNIGLLAHEGGDRLYIIRAKANIEFQHREKEERENKEKPIEAVTAAAGDELQQE